MTEERIDVANYVRIKGDYPQIQRAIEDLHRAFAASSFTVIEDNAMGAAVADNLDIPAHQLRRFTTSKTSKERIIEALRLQLQQQSIKFHPSLKQLESELRDYQLPDTNVVQDSVIALAITLDHASETRSFQAQGRIMGSLFRELNASPGAPMHLHRSRVPGRRGLSHQGSDRPAHLPSSAPREPSCFRLKRYGLRSKRPRVRRSEARRRKPVRGRRHRDAGRRGGTEAVLRESARVAKARRILVEVRQSPSTRTGRAKPVTRVVGITFHP